MAGNTYYSYENRTLWLRIGDYIEAPKVPDQKIGIARILKLYVKSEISDDEKYQAKVQWYAKPIDIPQHYINLTDPLYFYNNELIEDHREKNSIILLTSICNSVFVERASIFEGYHDNPYGYCRYRIMALTDKIFQIEPIFLLERNSKNFPVIMTTAECNDENFDLNRDFFEKVYQVYLKSVNCDLTDTNASEKRKQSEKSNKLVKKQPGAKKDVMLQQLMKNKKALEQATSILEIQNGKYNSVGTRIDFDDIVFADYFTKQVWSILKDIKNIKKSYHKDLRYLNHVYEELLQTHSTESYLRCSTPGREKFVNEIISYVRHNLLKGMSGFMSISGSRGTGKKCSIHAAVNILKKQPDLPPYRLVNVDEMPLISLKNVYIYIYKQLTGKIVSGDLACTLLKLWFRKPQTTPTVIVMKGFGSLSPKHREIFYNAVQWTELNPSLLTVLAISRTKYIAAKILRLRGGITFKITKLHFPVYTSEEIQNILKYYLANKKMTQEAITHIAKAVTSLTTDVSDAIDLGFKLLELSEMGELTSRKHVENLTEVLKFRTSNLSEVQEMVYEMKSQSMYLFNNDELMALVNEVAKKVAKNIRNARKLAQNTPALDAPAQDARAQDAPAQDAPVHDAPAQDAPAQDAPAQDAPAQDAPAQDAPAQDSPAQDAPAQDSPAHDASAQDAPAQNAPAQVAIAQRASKEKRKGKKKEKKN